MLVERFLIAAVFLAAGAVMIFGGGAREFFFVWVAAALVSAWVIYRIVVKRRGR